MIPVHLYDSRSKQLLEVGMDENKKTYLYVCGPTVYNHAHIGNARPLMVFDTLRRTLKACGFLFRIIQMWMIKLFKLQKKNKFQNMN